MARIARRQETSLRSDSTTSTGTKPSTATTTHHTTGDTRHPIISSSSAFESSSSTVLHGPLVTASSHPPVDSSSIVWGPAITAPSLKSTMTSAPTSPASAQSVPRSNFADGGKKAVIAVTTIGGTIILAFLLYALWRRRKGAPYSEIIRFQRHSGTISLGSPRTERLTALPIYREARYSIRSSKYGSTMSLGRQTRRPSGVPPMEAQRFYSQNPWLQDVWKGSEPPTDTFLKHPTTTIISSGDAPEVRLPSMARVYTAPQSRSTDGLQVNNNETHKAGPSVSVQAASPTTDIDEITALAPPSKEDDPARWSWTNSQAPPTPRMYAASHRSSMSSLPRFRKVKSWVRNQSDRQNARILSEAGIRNQPVPAIPILKNKASKPNLAPKPTRKLSKKSINRDSALLIQSNVDVSPAKPAAARTRYERQ